MSAPKCNLHLVLTTAMVAAALGFVLAPAEAGARAKPNLAVKKINGVPARALTGDKLRLKVKVTNKGKAKSKRSKVTAQLGPETGAPLRQVIGRHKVGPLKPRRSTIVRFKAKLPGSAIGAWKLTACVPPGTQRNDCRASSRVQVGDGSSWALIEAARASGDLRPGKADLYGLYALTGDSRLPDAYHGHGQMADAGVFASIAKDWASLSGAERDALWPYLLQPRYSQSAWAPSGTSKAGFRASAEDADAPPGACADLDKVQGAWNGVQTAHAWFWYRPGSSTGRANAHTLAREFTGKVWPKLTGAFKAIGDAAAAPCDPAGDAKLDIYLGSAGTIVSGAEGVTPPVPINGGCGPFPAFMVLNENEDRWTLAHEFMHAIQWAYKACARNATWVEGTATWAGDFVYPNDQDEHRWSNAVFFPYRSLLGEDVNDYSSGYHAWPFWYSVAKHGGPGSIKRFLVALGGSDFAGALAVLPGGLRGSWKHYAVESWNQAPIGSAGFPVNQSFHQWDSFDTKPVVGWDETDVELGGLAERTFDVKTYGPGGQAEPSRDLGPLSTSFSRIKINDRKVRELRFKNGLSRTSGTLVQAFLKLKNGSWRLEDWSDRGSVTLCRNNDSENVTELIVATSNASATGGPLGRATHQVRARNHCEPVPIQGTFSGTEGYTSSDGQITMNFRFNGNVELEPNGQVNPTSVFGGGWPDETWDRYTVKSGSYTLSGHGTSFGCTVDLIPATYQLGPQTFGAPNLMTIEPESEPRYGLSVGPAERQPQAKFKCPPDDTTYTGTFTQPGSVIYTKDPEQTTRRGTYQGSSASNQPGGGGSFSGNYNWSLSDG